jgi:hypothetical protein
MTMQRLRLFLTVALLLVACTAGPDAPVDDDDPVPAPTGPSADAVLVIEEGAAVGGPGITVSEALQQIGGEPVLVNGSLFIDAEGEILLCDAIAESFPPQCGGRRLLVENLDPARVPDLQEANGVRWAEGVTLLGSVE